MARFWILGCVMLTAGCLQEAGTVGDLLARDTAKSVVNTVVESRFPGVNAAPYTDCIIDNATTPEIAIMAEAAVFGVTPAITDLVVDIAGRPDTIRCFANTAPGFGGLGL